MEIAAAIEASSRTGIDRVGFMDEDTEGYFLLSNEPYIINIIMGLQRNTPPAPSPDFLQSAFSTSITG
jgi:hypothetical protein